MVASLLALTAASVVGVSSFSSVSLPPLHPVGKALVNPQGQPVTLKGADVGNWLVLEMWMMNWTDPKKGAYADQFELESILTKRFGQSECDRLMDIFRESWMGDRDWDHLKSYGFNLIRLPFNYRLLEDDAHPMKLKKDAFKWLDRAVNEAEKRGIYTILDMHGLQGGQSTYDHTGHSGQNKLWESPEYQDRAAWLWGQIAAHYKNRSAVVAYDLYNEPYGGTHEKQVALFKKLYPSVRAADPEKLIIASGHYDGFAYYGNPKANGWHNVGYQMHYYPGLFGGGAPTPENHARFIKNLDKVAAQVDEFNVPFLIGEFNVVLTQAGGAPLMRRYFDLYAKFGWMATMWTYKVMSDDGNYDGGSWGCVTSAVEGPKVDARTATKEEVEKAFRGFATVPLKVYEPLHKALTATNPELPPLPKIPDPVHAIDRVDSIPGWQDENVGGARAGGAQKGEGSQILLWGGGRDIWGSSDQFQYLCRKAEGNFEVTVTITGLVGTDGYAKSGLMARASLDANSPMAFLSAYPEGELNAVLRSVAGAEAKGIGEGEEARYPMVMKMTRVGDTITVTAKPQGKDWTQPKALKFHSGPIFVGVVALSHDDSQLTKATYENLQFRPLP